MTLFCRVACFGEPAPLTSIIVTTMWMRMMISTNMLKDSLPLVAPFLFSSARLSDFAAFVPAQPSDEAMDVFRGPILHP